MPLFTVRTNTASGTSNSVSISEPAGTPSDAVRVVWLFMHKASGQPAALNTFGTRYGLELASNHRVDFYYNFTGGTFSGTADAGVGYWYSARLPTSKHAARFQRNRKKRAVNQLLFREQ